MHADHASSSDDLTWVLSQRADCAELEHHHVPEGTRRMRCSENEGEPVLTMMNLQSGTLPEGHEA